MTVTFCFMGPKQQGMGRKKNPAMFPKSGEDQAGGDSNKSNQQFQASSQFMHFQARLTICVFSAETINAKRLNRPLSYA